MFKTCPKVSICIPVFNAERYLPACLESIAMQNYTEVQCENAEKVAGPKCGIEVVIVDDGSSNFLAKKIVNEFKKAHKKQKISVKFIRHKKNKGAIEARRTALYESTGEFVMFVDSDDTLPNDAVQTLFSEALKTSADIVQGKASVVSQRPSVENEKKANNIFVGELLERDIFDGFLLNCNHSGFLWGKIFLRKLCLKAFENIPLTYCVFGEDFLTYFFLSLFAKKYVGIENVVYNYNAESGISSNKKINSLEEWKKVCSAASIFTILFSWIEENNKSDGSEINLQITEEEADKVREVSKWYAKNNLLQLKHSVAPELQKQAYIMLCDFWGQNMIKKVEEC